MTLKREASIPFILMRAGDHLSHAMQWKDMMFGSAFSSTMFSLIEARALVSLVEEIDCGSIGGFGDGQPMEESVTIFRRWRWLCQKYWPEFRLAKNEGNGQAYFDYVVIEKFYEENIFPPK